MVASAKGGGMPRSLLSSECSAVRRRHENRRAMRCEHERSQKRIIGQITVSIDGVFPSQLEEALKEVKMPHRVQEHPPQHNGTTDDEEIEDIQRL